MRNSAIAAVLVVAAATTATALPAGLSGLSFGVGAGALTDGYIQAEFDFMLSQYVCLGPELGMGFGDGPGQRLRQPFRGKSGCRIVGVGDTEEGGSPGTAHPSRLDRHDTLHKRSEYRLDAGLHCWIKPAYP